MQRQGVDRASAGFLRRLWVKDVGERGGLYCLDRPCVLGGGGGTAGLAAAVCAAAAKLCCSQFAAATAGWPGLSHSSSGSCALQAGWPGPASY